MTPKVGALEYHEESIHIASKQKKKQDKMVNSFQKMWNKFASEWSISNLSEITKEVSLEGMEEEINTMLKGQQVGRVVLKI